MYKRQVKNYAFFCPAQGNNNNGKQGNVRTGMKDGSSELLLDESMKLDLNQYHTVRYEFQKGVLKVSVDGNPVGEKDTGYSIQEILKNGTEGDAMGYIGKSLYSPDPAFKGSLKSFKILAETKDHSDAGRLAEAKDCLLYTSQYADYLRGNRISAGERRIVCSWKGS